MKNFIYTSIIILVTFSSCVGVKPTIPDSDFNTEIPSVDSLITKVNIPININVKKLEEELNLKYPIGKRIYSVGHTNRRGNSRISHIRIDVRDKISISTSGGYIKAKIPLVADIRYEWWWWILGIKYSDYIRFRRLETNVFIDIRPKFNNDWGFNPDVKSKVRLNRTNGFLSFLINLQLLSKDGEISKDVKRAILKTIDVKSSVEKEYKKLSKPILLSSEMDSTWLSFKPRKFNFSPPISDQNILKLNFAFNSNILVKTGEKPPLLDLGELPNLGNELSYDNSLNLLLKYSISLNTLENLFNQKMVGTYTLENGRKIKINKIKVLGLNQNLALKIEFRSGKTYGWLYLVGKLNINESQMVYVTDLGFSTDTNNILIKKAIWLADKLFIRKIESEAKYSIKEALDQYKKGLNDDLKNIVIDNSIKINASVDSLMIKGLYINNKDLIVIPNANGKLNVSYD